MIPSKIAALCLVGFVLLANYIEARPAPEDEGPEKHVHHVHHEGHPGEHVHHHVHHRKPHVHHHKREGGEEPHVHHHKISGGGGAGGGGADGGGGDGGLGADLGLGGGGGSGGLGADLGLGGGAGGSGGLGADLGLGGGGGGGSGGLGADLGLGGGGGGSGGGLGLPGLGNLNLQSFSPGTISKFKKLLGNMNIDLSQLDLGDLGLGGGGGGAAGGAGGGGGIHKTDGKDSLQPAICDDSINDRYGVGKHFVRGVRDVGTAILSEAETILDPLLGGLTQGLGQGLKKILCDIENGFSDFGSDFDSATDIAKHGLVNFFKLQGPHPVLGIPVGIAGIAGEAVKAAASIGGDAIDGIGGGIRQLVQHL